MIWAVLFLLGVTIPEAESALRAGQYQEALRKFEELYALDPSNPRILEGLARSYEGLGEYSEALIYYTNLYQMEPANPRYRRKVFQLAMLLARRYRDIGDWSQARSYLELAVEVNPRDPTAWFWMGHVLERLGMRGRAIRAYARAAKLGSPEARKALRRLRPPEKAESPPRDSAPPPETTAPAPSETPDTLTLRVHALKESLATLILREEYEAALALVDTILTLAPNDLEVVNLRLQLREKLQAQRTQTAPPSPSPVSPGESWTDGLVRWGEMLAAMLEPYPPWMVYGGGGVLLLLLFLTLVSLRHARRRSRGPTRVVYVAPSATGTGPAPQPSAPASPSPSPAPQPSGAEAPPPSSPPRSAPPQRGEKTPPPSRPRVSHPRPSVPPPPEPSSPRTPDETEGPVDEVWATSLEEAFEVARRMDAEEEPPPSPPPRRGNPRKMISALVLIAMGRKQGGFQKDLTHGVFFGPGGYIIHAQWGDVQGEEALIKIIEEVDPEELKFVPGAIPPVRFTMKMSPKKLREFLKRYQQGEGS